MIEFGRSRYAIHQGGGALKPCTELQSCAIRNRSREEQASGRKVRAQIEDMIVSCAKSNGRQCKDKGGPRRQRKTMLEDLELEIDHEHGRGHGHEIVSETGLGKRVSRSRVAHDADGRYASQMLARHKARRSKPRGAGNKGTSSFQDDSRVTLVETVSVCHDLLRTISRPPGCWKAGYNRV